jgi:hypothetical protein
MDPEQAGARTNTSADQASFAGLPSGSRVSFLVLGTLLLLSMQKQVGAFLIILPAILC